MNILVLTKRVAATALIDGYRSGNDYGTTYVIGLWLGYL